MPRKKKVAEEASQAETATAATAVAEPETTDAPPPMSRPDYIDGPPVDEKGQFVGPRNPDAKNWGDPYKVIFSSKAQGFEMGEDRRFKQRVFKFTEKPAGEVLAALKEAGFTYRANEKAWTIQATPDTRRISEDLARQFTGEAPGRAM